MPTTFALNVDTVAVPPREQLRRAHTVPSEGLYQKGSSASMPSFLGDAAAGTEALSNPSLCGADGQPFAYPTPVCVRNTFVELVPPGRDPSLDEFFEERKAQSCPASWGPNLKDEDEAEVPLASSRTTACGSASGASVASTPPHFSDGEDVIDIETPRDLDEGPCAARAACMPSSTRAFQRTMSDYRRGLLSRPAPSNCQSSAVVTPSAYASTAASDCNMPRMQPSQFSTAWEVQAQYTPTADGMEASAFVADGMARRPGPIPSRMDGMSEGYTNGYSDGYRAPFVGYDSGYDRGYACQYASPMHCMDGPGCYSSADFAQQGGQMDYICDDATQQQQQHLQVLQLSQAIDQPAQVLPPPRAPPALAGTSLPVPPPPPLESPWAQWADSDDDDSALDVSAPTRGSLNHKFGRCKPCAFVHTKGCGNGFECPFCHLCEPGEKKKRRKDKLEARRFVREMRQAFPFGGGSDYSRRGSVNRSLMGSTPNK